MNSSVSDSLFLLSTPKYGRKASITKSKRFSIRGVNNWICVILPQPNMSWPEIEVLVFQYTTTAFVRLVWTGSRTPNRLAFRTKQNKNWMPLSGSSLLEFQHVYNWNKHLMHRSFDILPFEYFSCSLVVPLLHSCTLQHCKYMTVLNFPPVSVSL